MMVYSVTVLIDKIVAADWLHWMKQIHIPEVMETGCFINYSFEEIDNSENNETEQASYLIKYFCKSREDFKRYETQFAAQLQAKHRERYNGYFQASRTVSEAATQALQATG